MTPQELRERVQSSGLSHAQIAGRIGISQNVLSNYLNGNKAIPTIVEYAVLWIIHEQQAEIFLAGN